MPRENGTARTAAYSVAVEHQAAGRGIDLSVWGESSLDCQLVQGPTHVTVGQPNAASELNLYPNAGGEADVHWNPACMPISINIGFPPGHVDRLCGSAIDCEYDIRRGGVDEVAGYSFDISGNR